MISVIVCTRDRAEGLRHLLRSLRAMAAPPTLAWEVVVVDNGSGDHTGDVVAEAARAGLPVRHVVEPRRGLSRARNAGVQAARGDILAFTDDDCRVDVGWLARIDTEFRADPALAVLGGRVELFDARDRQVAVRTHPGRVVVTSFPDIMSFMIGCNLSCRQRLFQEIGLFDVRFGAGTGLASAEDWDFLHRARRAGARILYAPEVLLFHDHGRRGDADVEATRRGYTIGRWALYCKHAGKLDREMLGVAARDFRGLAEALVRGRLRPAALAPVARGIAAWLGALARRQGPTEP